MVTALLSLARGMLDGVTRHIGLTVGKGLPFVCLPSWVPTEDVYFAHEDEIYCFAAIGDKNENTLYSDLTGQFPVRSYDGMVYIFVAYVYKCNAILLRSMKSREDASMIEAFTSIYTELEAIGHKPKLHTARQNVEEHHHNANAAELAVKTAKYHIISHIATMNASCPIQLWSEIIPQMQDTLNMLRTSRNNDNLTA